MQNRISFGACSNYSFHGKLGILGNIPKLVAGPALILQEIGNLGTMFCQYRRSFVENETGGNKA